MVVEIKVTMIATRVDIPIQNYLKKMVKVSSLMQMTVVDRLIVLRVNIIRKVLVYQRIGLQGQAEVLAVDQMYFNKTVSSGRNVLS